MRVDVYIITFLKSPHRLFLYVKQQARRFLVNADHIVGKLINNFLNTKVLLLYSIPTYSYYR